MTATVLRFTPRERDDDWSSLRQISAIYAMVIAINVVTITALTVVGLRVLRETIDVQTEIWGA
jgi:hypothetical protein